MTGADFRHLLDLTRALRLAQRGNLARGIKPDREAARRLEAAIDYFVAERDDAKVTREEN
jgi:hypothetical protein